MKTLKEIEKIESGSFDITSDPFWVISSKVNEILAVLQASEEDSITKHSPTGCACVVEKPLTPEEKTIAREKAHYTIGYQAGRDDMKKELEEKVRLWLDDAANHGFFVGLLSLFK